MLVVCVSVMFEVGIDCNVGEGTTVGVEMVEGCDGDTVGIKVVGDGVGDAVGVEMVDDTDDDTVTSKIEGGSVSNAV